MRRATPRPSLEEDPVPGPTWGEQRSARRTARRDARTRRAQRRLDRRGLARARRAARRSARRRSVMVAWQGFRPVGLFTAGLASLAGAGFASPWWPAGLVIAGLGLIVLEWRVHER